MSSYQVQRRPSLFISSAKTSRLKPLQRRHLSDAAFSANRRVVDALLKSNDDGMVPTLLADAYRTSADGRAEVADVMAELRRRDPVRATQLLQKLALTRQETSDLSGLMSDFDREDGARRAPIDDMLRLAADNGGSVPGYPDPNDPNAPGGEAPDTEEPEPDPDPEEERDCSDYEDAVDEAKLAFDDATDEVRTWTEALSAAQNERADTIYKMEDAVGKVEDAFQRAATVRDGILELIDMLTQDIALSWLSKMGQMLRQFHRLRNGLVSSTHIHVLSFFGRHRAKLADENAEDLSDELESFGTLVEELNEYQEQYAALADKLASDDALVEEARSKLDSADEELEVAKDDLEDARSRLRTCKVA